VALRLDEIVARLGGEVVGAGGTAISRIAPLDAAGPGDLAFLANPKYRSQLEHTRGLCRDHGAANGKRTAGGDPHSKPLPVFRPGCSVAECVAAAVAGRAFIGGG
jgi:hypothetical protein